MYFRSVDNIDDRRQSINLSRRVCPCNNLHLLWSCYRRDSVWRNLFEVLRFPSCLSTFAWRFEWNFQWDNNHKSNHIGSRYSSYSWFGTEQWNNQHHHGQSQWNQCFIHNRSSSCWVWTSNDDHFNPWNNLARGHSSKTIFAKRNGLWKKFSQCFHCSVPCSLYKSFVQQLLLETSCRGIVRATWRKLLFGTRIRHRCHDQKFDQARSAKCRIKWDQKYRHRIASLRFHAKGSRWTGCKSNSHHHRVQFTSMRGDLCGSFVQHSLRWNRFESILSEWWLVLCEQGTNSDDHNGATHRLLWGNLHSRYSQWNVHQTIRVDP